MKPDQYYTVFQIVKQAAVATVLLVLAFSLTSQVSNFFSDKATCSNCNDLASQYANVGFEWSVCNSLLPGVAPGTNGNLMTGNLFSRIASPIPYVVPLAFVAVVIALGFGAWAYYRWGGTYGSTDALLYNTIVVTFFLIIGNDYFQMFPRAGCYLSAWNVWTIKEAFWFSMFTLVPLIFYAATLHFLQGLDTRRWLEYFFLATSFLAVGLMLGISFFLAIKNLQHTTAVAHLIYVCAMTLFLIDGLAFRYFYPPAGKDSALQQPLVSGKAASS